MCPSRQVTVGKFEPHRTLNKTQIQTCVAHPTPDEVETRRPSMRKAPGSNPVLANTQDRTTETGGAEGRHGRAVVRIVDMTMAVVMVFSRAAMQVTRLIFTSAHGIGRLPLGRVVLDSALIALVKYPRGFESHTRPLLPRLCSPSKLCVHPVLILRTRT